MKMEVLTTRNHPFQRTQFDVIGSNKIQDWATPMTPRLSAAIPVPKPHKPHHHKSFTNQQRLQSHHTELTSNNNNHDIKHHLAGDTTPTSGPPFPGEAQLSPTTLALAGRLQSELRAAKSRHLACTEVLLPSTLLNHVASEMVSMAELEPCGIRGCCVYIEFEDEPGNSRRIASLHVDESTVATFELYLTLKHDRRGGWTSILPQFLKNLARCSTIMISPDYILTKNKLYNLFLD